MITITNQSHLRITQVLLEIMYDTDMIRQDPEPTSFEVLSKYGPHLKDIEEALWELTYEDFDKFCSGEHEEMMEVINRSPILKRANEMLNDWFNDETDHPC